MVLLLAAARGKHGRRAMGVGVEWIEELLWLAGRANRGGAVESAGWWVEENEEKGDPEVDRDRVAAARRKDGTALPEFRVAPFIYAGGLG